MKKLKNILLLIIILVYLLAEFYTKRQIKKLEKKVYAKYDVKAGDVANVGVAFKKNGVALTVNILYHKVLFLNASKFRFFF
jgi:hypothetical protein